MQYRALLFCAATVAGCGARPSASNPTGASDLAERAPGDAGAVDLASAGDANLPPADLALPADTLAANRDRLLATYLAYLHAHPAAQSNGLDGTVGSVCALWGKLDGSSQAVYLTLTARLQGSRLGADGSSMLSHVARLYRLTGGQGAAAGNPGSCGGGEYNRMMMSMDPTLQQTLVAANSRKGATAPNGQPDLADVPGGGNRFWRDSHDLGGPHAPFDLSDETDSGAPRGQVQYFRDPSSAAALG